MFEPAKFAKKRFDSGGKGTSLWDRDVVEAFIGSGTNHIRRYAEFEVAPTNERLDLMITNLPEKDFGWNSRFRSQVHVDERRKVWTCEMQIPIAALSSQEPSVGTSWPLNLYRCDRANKAFLGWRPTLAGSFHTPERFGTLTFVE